MTTLPILHIPGPGMGPPLIPFFGGLMFLLLLTIAVIAFLVLRKRGQLPFLTPAPTPEATAQTILAERFAKGELSPEEFMERASLLNWTPGRTAPKS